MADHHQLVDQIRAFVQSSDQTLTPRLEELAKEYADACVSINTRLSRCQRLLQQGLRSEAIQSAESEPKLLDVIAALDFPERPEWDEIASLYGLPAAPPMSIEAAGFLNEAYALEDPLRELLRSHRRLALTPRSADRPDRRAPEVGGAGFHQSDLERRSTDLRESSISPDPGRGDGRGEAAGRRRGGPAPRRARSFALGRTASRLACPRAAQGRLPTPGPPDSGQPGGS